MSSYFIEFYDKWEEFRGNINNSTMKETPDLHEKLAVPENDHKIEEGFPGNFSSDFSDNLVTDDNSQWYQEYISTFPSREYDYNEEAEVEKFKFVEICAPKPVEDPAEDSSNNDMPTDLNNNLMTLTVENSTHKFSCDKCPKQFRSKTALICHKIIHSKKIIKCDTCSKIFRRPCELILHKKIHEPKRLQKSQPTMLQCDNCAETFDSKINIEKHLLYQCNFPK